MGQALNPLLMTSLVTLLATTSATQSPTLSAAAIPNDNRVSAGRLVGGAFSLQLETREADWYPEGPRGPAIPVFAFAEVGRASSVPGPMIRVPVGTTLHVTVHNRLTKPMTLRGLQDHGDVALESVVIAAGVTRELQFRATVPGTFLYWARTEPAPALIEPGSGRDALLAGAFVVDSGAPPSPRERVLLISSWADTLARLGTKSSAADRVLRRELFARDQWVVIAVNGRSWPHTERLSYTEGDTITWRVINGGFYPHPMHLHGFYFTVNARGDARRDTLYPAPQRRLAVTEWLIRGTTMQMTWVAERPGNWLYHCHFVTHITDALQLAPDAAVATPHGNHAETGMAGLVIGIHVAPRGNPPPAPAIAARRRLRVFVTERAGHYGDLPAYSYVLQEGPAAPAPDSLRRPGSTIVLRQNQPTEITVVNRAHFRATIHWHGIELESFYDGVGDWSGWGTRTAPAIAPGDSFVVRLTPPRAGTFIYHTHTNEGIQLASGLYGALIVLPEHAPADSADQLLLISVDGPLDDARTIFNGSAAPGPLTLRAGTPQRLRLINITPMETQTIQLVSPRGLEQWRAVAKDGADLPPQQAIARPATVALHPGNTYDVELSRQHPESLSLRIVSPGSIRALWEARARGSPLPRDTITIPVIVR